jgi:hypothetical protein
LKNTFYQIYLLLTCFLITSEKFTFILFIHIVLIFCLVVSTKIGQECNKCSTQWILVEFLMLKKEGLTLTSLCLFEFWWYDMRLVILELWSIDKNDGIGSHICRLIIITAKVKKLHSRHKSYFLAHRAISIIWRPS